MLPPLRRSAAAFALLAAAAVPLAAQKRVATPPVVATAVAAPGDHPLPFDSIRVGMLARLNATGLLHGGRLTVLQARFGDTLVIKGVKNHELVRVPGEHIEWMQVSTGHGWTQTGVVRGAIIGLAAGALFAHVLEFAVGRKGTMSPQDCPPGFRRIDCRMSPEFFAGAMIGGFLGGAGIGAQIGGERWRPVKLP